MLVRSVLLMAVVSCWTPCEGLLFGAGSHEATPTVTQYLLLRSYVTSTLPSSCVVVQPSMPACRRLRQLGPASESGPLITRIEPTRVATLEENRATATAEGRTFGWFRSSTTTTKAPPAQAQLVIAEATPQLQLQDVVLGAPSLSRRTNVVITDQNSPGTGQAVLLENQPQQVTLVDSQPSSLGQTVYLQESQPAAQVVVGQQAQPQTVTLVGSEPSSIGQTVYLQESQPAAQVVVGQQAQPQTVTLVQSQPGTVGQQVYLTEAQQSVPLLRRQPVTLGNAVLVQQAQPQQQVSAVTTSHGEAHRLTWGEWLGLYNHEPARVEVNDGAFTVQRTLLQTSTRVVIDPSVVVTFSVTGCEPTRLPFDLDYCESARPPKAAEQKPVITVVENTKA